MSQDAQLHAIRRFGLGPRPDALRDIGRDPRAYVLAQLDRPDAAEIRDEALPPTHEVLQFEQRRNQKRRALRKSDAPDEEEIKRLRPGPIRRRVYLEETAARVHQAVTTATPFVERLVLFWSNHFAVSARKGIVRGVVGAFEREAIRPHVLGRFADLLRAVEQHPAMLIYLDNRRSMGANSRAGQRRRRGHNENLAREILELHTVTETAGYTQADVTNFAKIITGWSIAPHRPDRGREGGTFRFLAHMHEPGDFEVLGTTYDQRGVRAGEAVLEDLARHPATADHIARKLAVHFVSDTPPAELVEKLAATFRETDGDLAAVSRALVTHKAAWAAPAEKVTPPFPYLVGIMRALDLQPRPREVVRLLRTLGQPLWAPPTPKGWPDGDMDWAGPAALRERLRIAGRAARRARGAPRQDPRSFADALFGPHLTDPTRIAIARAETVEQGLQLLIMSPEFQRR
ncbi:MAG: DUF1800 domain-containing protein [Pseudomonadota bacterium]